MGGRLKDAWPFAWSEIWLKLEEMGEMPLDIYGELYVELAKAFRKAPQRKEFDNIANEPELARETLKNIVAADLRGENSIARFLENAFDVLTESGIPELPLTYRTLIITFLVSRNLRYELTDPFHIRPHVSGVFSALVSDVMAQMQNDDGLREAVAEFEHAFGALTRSHAEPDMKTCIQKASLLVEAIASNYPHAEGATLADLCDNIKCWPHKAVKDSVKNLYGFCSDYPGIRHNVGRRGRIRPLEMRDSIIVPLLLLTASGYFGANPELMATLRSQTSDPPQLPADEPLIDPDNPSPNLP